MATLELDIDPSKTSQPVRDLADSLEKVNEQTGQLEKTFKTTFSKSTDAVDQTTNAIDDQTKSQKKSAEANDQLKKGVVDFSKASKKAYDDKPVDEYTKSVKQSDKATEDLDKSTDELGKNSASVFGELSEGLGDIGGEFQGLGEGLVSGEGGGISGGLTGILGKLGPIGLAVGAVVGGVVALGSEIIDVDKKFDDLRGTVEQLFKVTGDEADRLVINVEAIAQTFDQDVNDVLLTTNALSKEFGISGEAATNLLAKGFNSSANAQGDLLDSAREYSSQIRAAGGDADVLFRILEKSNEEGIFSDKGIDVIKEAGLRLREQGDSTKVALENAFGADFADRLFSDLESGAITSVDAISLISGELGGLDEQSKEAQSVIADVFGGAGEDAGFRFLTLLEDINEEQAFGNEELTESQRRQKENLEANQRLAAAQNELSKAIGDSSAIGRVWTDIQAGFFKILVSVVGAIENLIKGFELLKDDPIEGLKQIGIVILDFVLIPLNLAISAVNTFVGLFGFDDVISNVGFAGDAVRDFTEEQERNIAVTREAQKAIKNYGEETARQVNQVNKYFDALKKGAATEERQLEIVNQLNEQYPEQIKNVDLLTASNEELLKIKQDIIRAEVEASITEKKNFALRQTNLEIEKRRTELLSGVSQQRAKVLRDEIKFLEENFKNQIDLVEQETRILLGLEERKNDEIIEDAELTEEELARISQEGAAARSKAQNEFNKAIQDILKKGQQAELQDQFISQEERINNQRDFQRQELANLLEHARDLNEALIGTRELDQEVIDAFNRADEKIITDAQDKIFKINEKKRMEERAAQLRSDQEVLNAKKLRFDQEIALLNSQQEEELSVVEQSTRNRGEGQAEFERRVELEKLNIQEFFLQKRLELIDRENSLKINALNLELEALADKEGAAVEIQRVALEEKRALLEQETSAQQTQLNTQLQNTQQGIQDLENAVPSLGEVFGKLQEQLGDALNLSPEQIGAISNAIQQVAGEIFNTIQEGVQKQIEANDEVLAKLDEREGEVKESLEREIEFAQLGYAANVEGKRQELLDIQEAEQEAQAKRADLLRQQEALDTASQVVSLVTASANLYKSLSGLPFGIGIAIATALTGAMFAAFISTKAKAKNVASLEKGGYGNDTGLISGKRHSQGGEALLDHVEVEKGEMWSVYNRSGSNKYAKIIRDFTEAVNTDNVDGFLGNTETPLVMMKNNSKLKNDEIQLQAVMMSEDLKENMNSLPVIKNALLDKFKEPKTTVYKDNGSTYVLLTYPNGSRKRIKLKD